MNFNIKSILVIIIVLLIYNYTILKLSSKLIKHDSIHKERNKRFNFIFGTSTFVILILIFLLNNTPIPNDIVFGIYFGATKLLYYIVFRDWKVLSRNKKIFCLSVLIFDFYWFYTKETKILKDLIYNKI